MTEGGTEEDDESVVRRAMQGDSSARAVLARKYTQDARDRLNAYLGDRADGFAIGFLAERALDRAIHLCRTRGTSNFMATIDVAVQSAVAELTEEPESYEGPVVSELVYVSEGESSSEAPLPQDLNLLDEFVHEDIADRATHSVHIPPKERTRRGVLVGLAVAFVGVFLLQLGCALFLDATTWQRVAPILSSFATLVAGGLGAAFGFYFSGKD